MVETISKILQPYLDLGPLFMIFFVFTIMGIVLKLGILNSIRTGLMFSVGFNGIYIVVDFFLNSITPAAYALSEKFGGVFTYTDVGVGAVNTTAWSHPIAYVIMIASVLLNLVMIVLNLTDTINLNIWDFWEADFCALIIIALTGNYIVALVVACTWSIVSLWLSDWWGHKGYTEDFYGFDGLTLYQGVNNVWGMFGYAVSKVLDKLPFVDNPRFTPEKIQEKLGVLGEPVVIGGFIGMLMGIGAGFWWGDIVLLMINLATGMVILPMSAGIIMQALVPITEATNAFLEKRTGGSRSLYVGVDCAVAVGNTTNLAIIALMIPVMLVLAFIIPGMMMVPLGDLSNCTYFWVYIIAPNKGDILRSMIACTLAGILAHLMMSKQVAYVSAATAMMGVGNGRIGSTFLGFCPDTWFTGLIAENFTSVGIVLIMIVFILLGVFNRFMFLKKKKEHMPKATEA